MKVKPIWLSLIVIVCFLCVHFKYNFAPFESVGLALYSIIREYGFTFDTYDYPLQFIIVASFLIVVSIFEKKIFIIAGIIMLMLLLSFWVYRYSYFLEFSYISMMPFILTCIVSIIILLRGRVANPNLNVTNPNAY